MLHIRCIAMASSMAIALTAAKPASTAPTAAAVCPPMSFADAVNRAANPSFETVGPFGTTSVCPKP